MQKLIFLLLLCLLSTISYSVRVVSKDHLKSEQGIITIPTSYAQISLIKLIKLTPKEYKKLTGVKPSLKEILVLKTIQIKIKKGLKKGHSTDLYLSKTGPRKKPKLWVALLIVLGLAILSLGLLFLMASRVY